jgi:plastocyanin
LRLNTRELVVAAACGIAVGVPALAYGRDDPPASATVTAIDTGNGLDDHYWSGGTVTIVKGGTVTFRYPSGAYNTGHSVSWTGDAPTRCRSMPTTAFKAPPWEGSCDFETTGEYAFACPIHPSMTGKITVVAPSPSATPTPTATPGASATPTPTPGPGGGVKETQTTLTGAVAIAKSQKGTRVRGSVQVKLAGSRLEVSLWAPRKALSGGKSSKLVRIGRSTRASTPAGKVNFAVGTDAKARSALRRHRRLSVTVSIALTPPGGHKLTRSVKSTLRAG